MGLEVTREGLSVETGPVVRAAEPRDVPRLGATLTVALADSRWTRWALPVDGRVQRLTRLHELLAHRGAATGTAWVDTRVDSVAAWEAPDGAPDTQPVPADVAGALAREVPYLHGERARVVADTAALVSAVRPSGPHWWLATLATRPSARRRGLATAVLAPGLRRADHAGLPAATAVHSWAAVRFLRGSGFEVSETLRTSDDQLAVYVLVRAPQPV
ncbi:GNAT family N-acetyltransferase [Modestobacter sp. I12A-02628]|uniref:GNAT family N-acetyltransferase n=2 Tax=Goekera deserti TaxID=2497753 RepID=A0A7K3WIW9_9ACTN|nr:GNAT family N-acetyltransferase [Goekera deserti]NDI47339.1 GNAT family N-acetyltransferase [Goekera deserti]NEL55869.1 GNAT family N-acetyltransferase [Goekera deserti]